MPSSLTPAQVPPPAPVAPAPLPLPCLRPAPPSSNWEARSLFRPRSTDEVFNLVTSLNLRAPADVMVAANSEHPLLLEFALAEDLPSRLARLWAVHEAPARAKRAKRGRFGVLADAAKEPCECGGA